MRKSLPIQNLDKLDIVGERMDGGLDLVIVASGPLDESPDTLHALRHKILNYLTEAGSPTLRSRYSIRSGAKIRIVVNCQHSISGAAMREIEQLMTTARDANLTLELEAE
jgi:hypothetical protein